MSKVLITGGAGFIGFHLANYLSDNKNCEISIIDNFTRNKKDKNFNDLIGRDNVKFINADMTTKDFYSSLSDYYDEIYHLAAINGTKYFYEKPYEVLRVNILSLINIIEWINESNCGKFIFSSSSEAYAGTINKFSDFENYFPTKEDISLSIDDVFNSRFSYGGSKITGELITINYFKKINVSYSIIRYHNIYGPRMGYEHVIPEFLMKCYKKEVPFTIFGGQETRAFCYVMDAVKASELVMKNNYCDGQIIHIGNSNEEIKIIELAKKIIDHLNLNLNIKVKNAPQGSVMRRCPDTSKLYKLTGFMAETPLDEGIELSNNWYRKNIKS